MATEARAEVHPPASEAETGAPMTLIAHLREFRHRLIVSVIALVVATLISALFAKQLLLFLVQPVGSANLQFLRPTESFVIYMKVSFLAGIALAMPVLLYQLLRFVMPGLTATERRYVWILIPGGAISFVIGLAFANLILVPQALRFLSGFLADVAPSQWSFDAYISFVTTFLLWVGLSFETPLVIYVLVKLGVVRPETLARQRKYAILGAFILAAIITPTPDPFNQTLVALPLILLFEVGIWLGRLA